MKVEGSLLENFCVLGWEGRIQSFILVNWFNKAYTENSGLSALLKLHQLNENLIPNQEYLE